MSLKPLLCAGSILNHYKGFAGGVRSLQCSSDGTQSLLAACGLDRFLRVFALDPPRLLHQVLNWSSWPQVASRPLGTGSGLRMRLVHVSSSLFQIYLKLQCNCLLFSDEQSQQVSSAHH